MNDARAGLHMLDVRSGPSRCLPILLPLLAPQTAVGLSMCGGGDAAALREGAF